MRTGKALLDHARTALLQAEAAKEAAVCSAHLAKPTFALGFLSGSEIGLLPDLRRFLTTNFPASTSACRAISPLPSPRP